MGRGEGTLAGGAERRGAGGGARARSGGGGACGAGVGRPGAVRGRAERAGAERAGRGAPLSRWRGCGPLPARGGVILGLESWLEVLEVTARWLSRR
ncbi:unnamed protein product [Caretta caretta]